MFSSISTNKAKGQIGLADLLKAKVSDYLILVKYKLNFTVVFSAVIGLLLANIAYGSFSWLALVLLAMSGFIITGSANAINQILEKDYDKLMKRTAGRPLAAGRMNVTEALLLAGILGVGGILILWYFFNENAALLGAVSLISYAFIYTPLKRVHPIAVLVGAIPGALPPVIGWVALTGTLTYEAYILFAIQFLWQFPHFWAIGWLGAEEYEKAGFKLMPTSNEKNKGLGIQVILYIGFLIMTTVLPGLIGMFSFYFVFAALISGLFFLYYGFNLFRYCDDKAALKLMLASVIYLPVLQIIMVLDSLIF